VWEELMSLPLRNVDPVMKVLMVISQFSPMVGGAEKQAQLLSRTLIEKGIDVSIVTGWWVWGTRRREVIDGIHVYRNFAFWRMFGIPGLRTLGVLAYMVSLGIFLYINRNSYDLIHVHQALFPAFVVTLVGNRILNKAVVVKAASTGVTGDIYLWKQFPMGSLQLRYLLKKMKCLITVSKAGGDEYRAAGFPESNMRKIPNGVLIPEKGKESYAQGMNVVTISRLSKEKGMDILLKAWTRVSKEITGARLSIIGSGPLEGELREISHSMGLDRSVYFIGTVDAVDKYLESSDLFVLPSRTEGLSNALLEAMSYGIPCIATDVGGTPEIFGVEDHGMIPCGTYWIAGYGIMTRPEDAEGLSNAMLYLMRNERSRQEIGIRARAHVTENYSIDAIGRRYAELYRSLVGRNKEIRNY